MTIVFFIFPSLVMVIAGNFGEYLLLMVRGIPMQCMAAAGRHNWRCAFVSLLLPYDAAFVTHLYHFTS